MADNTNFDPDAFLSGSNPSPQLQTQVSEQSAQPQAFDPDQFLAPELEEQKFTSLPQSTLATLEGIGRGAAGPLAPMAEQALGIPAEDIRAREEHNPGLSMIGTIAGLAGTAGAGAGLGKVLGVAGETAAKLAGEAGLNKIGSSAVAGAIENIAFQAQDEVSKLVLKDPDQTAQTAVIDVGLAGLLGGAIGAVPPLWKAAMGNKTEGVLKAITDKMGGIDGTIPEPTKDALNTIGVDVPSEVQGLLSQDPHIQQMAKTLQQSDTTTSGIKFQKSFEEAKNNLDNSLIGSFNKTPDEITSMEDLSKYNIGKEIGNTLADEYQQQIGPIGESFNNLKSKYKDIPLNETINIPGQPDVPGTTAQLADKIGQTAIKEGWTALPDSDKMQFVNKVMKGLPNLKNLGDLGNFISEVGDLAQSKITPLDRSMSRVGGIVKGILRDGESNLIQQKLGQEEGSEAVNSFQNARQAYAKQADLQDSLDSRLHAKGSVSNYADSIREMANTDGEAVLNRLSGLRDANLLQFLGQNYPKTLDLIRNYHVNDLFRTASDKAKPDSIINSGAFISKYNKLSPEIKNLIADPVIQDKIKALEYINDQFNRLPHNFSNTARTVDKLLGHIPGSALGLAALLEGHGAMAGLLLGGLAKYLGKDVPDAARLQLLKFLGSTKGVNASGFKSGFEYINSTMNGENILGKAAKNIFTAGKEVLPSRLMPQESDRNKLNKIMSNIKDNPKLMMGVTNDIGHYMPDHATALSSIAANAFNYIQNQKPSTSPMNPLDSKRQLTNSQTTQYNRTLDIANQPLMILNNIKNGTILPSDVKTLNALYPALYQRMAQKVTNEMMTAISKGEIIPYKTKIGVSLFLGQPMDSTMTPQGILNAQPMPTQQPQIPQSMPKRQRSTPAKSSMQGIQKLPSIYSTPEQNAAKDRQIRE